MSVRKLQINNILKKPILSEKSTVAGENNYYVFLVDKRATKPDIKNAIEHLYDVKVGKVKTLRTNKIKKFKMRSSVTEEKKAYVQVLESASIVFEEELSVE